MKKVLLCAGMMVALVPWRGQAQVVAGLSRIPLWPKDGNTSRYFGQYVFLELATGKLVVSVPSSLNPDSSPSGDRIFRVTLPTGVVPDVEVTSQNLADGRFQYTYQVTNESAAANAITNWALETASFDRTDLYGPANWLSEAVTKQPGTENLYARNLDHHATWVISAVGQQPIAPKATVGGFVVVSPALPGFMVAHFQGGPVVSESTEALPPAVRAQLEPLVDMEYASTTVPVIGPKFSPNEPSVAIAGELHADISRLVALRWASASSQFISAAFRTLETYIASTPVDQKLDPTITTAAITVPPAGSVERQIALALKQSLGINSPGL